ncbi:MAG: phosphatidylglycerophosphatase A [Methanobrevibacter sp.]|jgi:alpha-ribazole phosphatase CobZ|nr:phosphatidylglycerophosphatase A [Methanobrevibacter sp.]
MKNRNKNKKINRKLFDNIQLNKDSESVYISTSGSFLAINDLEISKGIDITKNIVILSPNTFKSKELDESYISHAFENESFFVEKSEKIAIMNFSHSSLKQTFVTQNLKVIESESPIANGKLDLGQIIIINDELNIKELMELYKIAIETKVKYFEYQKFPDQFQELLNNNEFLVLACPTSKIEEMEKEGENEKENEKKNEKGTEKTDEEKRKERKESKKKLAILKNELVKDVVRSCKYFLDNMEIDFGILDYILAEGVTIDDLVDAGMELLVGIEDTKENKELIEDIKIKLKNQLLKSLEDINVIALIISAIRCEDDFQVNRVREVDVSEDPAYLYTDEVLGIAIANQIAGTKATFNFKRYDEAKPGILSTLGPMLDDIFAGLIAGCMSKIFEE